MALSTEAAAVNVKTLELATAWKAYWDTLSATDVIQVTPLDHSEDSETDKAHFAVAVGDLATAGTGLHPSFSEVHSFEFVTTSDAAFMHTLPITFLGGTPLFWVVTNQAQELA